jgi:hypothetical protein
MKYILGIYYEKLSDGFERKYHFLDTGTTYPNLGGSASYNFDLLKGDIMTLEHIVKNKNNFNTELYFGEDFYLKSNHINTIVNYFVLEYGLSEDYQYEIPTVILIEILKKYVDFVEKNPL